LKLRALDIMLDRLTAEQKKEAGVTANVIISLIDRMKREVSSPLPKRYSWFEADTYHTHGRMLSTKERKRVQGGQWFTLRNRFKWSKQSAMIMVLLMQCAT
jgi:hypothetical protein